MCFNISKRKLWKTTIVYKYVTRALTSPTAGTYDCNVHGQEALPIMYAPKTVVKAVGKRKAKDINGVLISAAGIYVYRHADMPLSRSINSKGGHVIELAVDPKDCIAVSPDNQQATYSKAIVVRVMTR